MHGCTVGAGAQGRGCSHQPWGRAPHLPTAARRERRRGASLHLQGTPGPLRSNKPGTLWSQGRGWQSLAGRAWPPSGRAGAGGSRGARGCSGSARASLRTSRSGCAGGKGQTRGGAGHGGVSSMRGERPGRAGAAASQWERSKRGPACTTWRWPRAGTHQSVHAELPAAAAVPGGHGAGSAVPPGQSNPGGHTAHRNWPPPTATACLLGGQPPMYWHREEGPSQALPPGVITSPREP